MTIRRKAVEVHFTMFFNFTRFVTFQNLSVLDLALLEVKELTKLPVFLLRFFIVGLAAIMRKNVWQYHCDLV